VLDKEKKKALNALKNYVYREYGLLCKVLWLNRPVSTTQALAFPGREKSLLDWSREPLILEEGITEIPT